MAGKRTKDLAPAFEEIREEKYDVYEQSTHQGNKTQEHQEGEESWVSRLPVRIV